MNVLPSSTDPFTSSRLSAASGSESFCLPSRQRLSVLRAFLQILQKVQRGLGVNFGSSGQRRVRVTETASLGEKRFVSIVSIDGVEYLIGGGTTTVSLLTQLPNRNMGGQADFAATVNQAWNNREGA